MSLNVQQPDDRGTSESIAPEAQGSGAKRRTGWTVGIIVIAIIAVAGGIATSFYIVPAGHRGVVFRLGKLSDVVAPGPHFKAPFRIDTVIEVNTDTIETESFGFRSSKAGVRTRDKKDRESRRESSMLTGDLNMVDIEWSVHYKHRDPGKFLTAIHDPVQTIRDTSESNMRRIVSEHSFDDVLTNREQIRSIFLKNLQKSLDVYGSGIQVVDVRLRNVLPPDEVRDAYHEVHAARQEKESLVNQALEAYNREIPKARGEAESLVTMAQGYALERVNVAKGETSRFNDVLREYRNAKEVTRKRLYLETCREILPRAGKVHVVDPRQKNTFPMLDAERRVPGAGGAK